MVTKKQETKSRNKGRDSAGIKKFILTPPGNVRKSVLFHENPKAAREVCEDCGLQTELLSKYGASVLQTHRRINAIVVSVPDHTSERLKRDLEKKGFRVEESKRVYPLLNETVPSLKIPEIWKLGFDGGTVACAILDTGIDRRHPDFKGRIAEYKDFTTEGMRDLAGHGTHVAGIISGAGSKYRGIAPKARLVIGKVLSADGGDDTDVIAGLSWASKQKDVLVMNLSLGGPGTPDDPLSRECDALAEEGFVLCVAAGNSGPGSSTIDSPGNAAGVITVGAVDKDKILTSYSSRGPISGKTYTKPDLVCYGGGVNFDEKCIYQPGITSTRSHSSRKSACDETRLYTRMSGTSMASPHVSGIAVVLFDALNQLGKDWTLLKKAEMLKKALLKNCVGLDDPDLTRWDAGAGLPDPVKALQYLMKFKTSVHKRSPHRIRTSKRKLPV
jgi:subtilisin family serine protease